MRPITKNQIRSLQIAARQVGLRSKEAGDGRYKLLLMQYKKSDGLSVQSSTELDQRQFEDFMCICESLGFEHFSGDKRHFRDKRDNRGSVLSLAQREAILAMADDYGWSDEHLQAFCVKMGKQPLTKLSSQAAGTVIEAFKNMLGRRDNKAYNHVSDVANQYAEVK